MYRLCLLFILSTFVHLTSHGQFTILAESQKFDEIEDGLNKTIILQDGTTCNLTIYRDSKIEVRTFDKNFNQLISKSVTTQFGYLGIGADLAAIFEANQQIVLFITCCELSVPTAYRIVIDPLHGTIIKQDKLWFDENKKDRARDYSLAGMSVMLPVIAIRFDPITQNYVSCFLNTTEPPDKRALEVYVFNKNHELIHTNILNWGSKNIYDYIRILDMVITGEKAYIALQAYNSSVVHKDIGTNIIIDCSKEGTQTEFVKIEAETDMTMGGALINYNPADKKVYLLTQYFITRKMKKEDNNIFETANKMYVYDPASKKVEKGKPVSAPGVLDFEKSIAQFYFHPHCDHVIHKS